MAVDEKTYIDPEYVSDPGWPGVEWLPAGGEYLTLFRSAEYHLYGSSRLGLHLYVDTLKAQVLRTGSVAFTPEGYWNDTMHLTPALPIPYFAPPSDSTYFHTLTRGEKRYELSNHLGNVLVTVSDRKLQLTTDEETVSGYIADVWGVNDYAKRHPFRDYAFGMLMPGRNQRREGYRFGFNGQEKDDEMKGTGNSINYIARIYDPRLGRFLSVDLLTQKFPELTPYQFASNTSIWGVDLDGEEVRIYTESPKYYKGNVGHTFITVGDAKDVIVYTYGRYAEIDAPSGGHSGSLNSLSPSGQGVLIKLTGDRASEFLNKAFKNEEVNAYEITDADEGKTAAYFESQFNSPNATVPTIGKYKGDDAARVVDVYDLENNNCTTKSCEAVTKGGSSIFKKTTQEVMTIQTVRRGGESDFILKGTGKFETKPITAPWSPGGIKQTLDYQDQVPANPINNVTNDVKPK